MHAMLFRKLADHVDQLQDVAKVKIVSIPICIVYYYQFRFVLGIKFFLISLDTSAYVEYSSSSDDEEKSVNRSKPARRRRDDSDSGSDVSVYPMNVIITKFYDEINR